MVMMCVLINKGTRTQHVSHLHVLLTMVTEDGELATAVAVAVVAVFLAIRQ